MAITHTRWTDVSGKGLPALLLIFVMMSGRVLPAQTSDPDRSSFAAHSLSSSDAERAQDDLESCRVHRVTGLPGSHEFAGDFIEAMASDRDPNPKEPNAFWALTADLSEAVPARDRVMYISKSMDGGATWKQVARVDSRYFDAKIGEGLRNGFIAAPGGAYFVITTQKGAFQVIPQAGGADALVRPIEGPRVPDTPPKIPITKKPGEPVRANVVEMTADGSRLIIGYGYFDLTPQMFHYRRGNDGLWIEDGEIQGIPTEMDLLSAQFDDMKKIRPGFLYVGTGDQVYLLNLRTMGWSMVDGVGPDSAIHGMSVVGGLHVAACWGVYNPVGPGMVKRVTNAKFLLHRTSDEAGPNLRAYSIEVDALRPERKIVTSITGVYTSQDSGRSWRRLNDLPDGEYRSAHFNSDGTVLVSGMPGTFLVNPFSDACWPRLKRRIGR
jgi:hypothetical protein